jgi:hypothetical protein
MSAGAEVTIADKVVGHITSTVGDVALAMVRREVQPGTDVQVGNATAVVEATSSG